MQKSLFASQKMLRTSIKLYQEHTRPCPAKFYKSDVLNLNLAV